VPGFVSCDTHIHTLTFSGHGDATIDEPGLTVPHPRARERAFVMDPLREVWPDAVIAPPRA